MSDNPAAPTMFALDASTGATLWSYPAGGSVVAGLRQCTSIPALAVGLKAPTSGSRGPRTPEAAPRSLPTAQPGTTSCSAARPGFAVDNEALLFVPEGYVSGAFLSGSATSNNASAVSLGITRGRYTWTWGSAADQSFTLDAFTAVPGPAAPGVFGFGPLLLGGFLTLRGRQAGSAC